MKICGMVWDGKRVCYMFIAISRQSGSSRIPPFSIIYVGENPGRTIDAAKAVWRTTCGMTSCTSVTIYEVEVGEAYSVEDWLIPSEGANSRIRYAASQREDGRLEEKFYGSFTELFIAKQK